jgi:hypothetical protein
MARMRDPRSRNGNRVNGNYGLPQEICDRPPLSHDFKRFQGEQRPPPEFDLSSIFPNTIDRKFEAGLHRLQGPTPFSLDDMVSFDGEVPDNIFGRRRVLAAALATGAVAVPAVSTRRVQAGGVEAGVVTMRADKEPCKATSRKADESLPITPFREQILDAIRRNDITIIVAPTGTGKSTAIPRWLVEEEMGTVTFTNPRRIACELLGNYGGEDVGWRHGVGRDFSKNTKVMYTTAPYEFKRRLSAGPSELVDVGSNQHGLIEILGLDEFHELTTETTLLLDQYLENPRGKVVITSATLDAAALVERLESRRYGLAVEAVEIPAPHRFPVEYREPKQGESIAAALAFSPNSLLYVYGHRPMIELAEDIRKINPRASIVLLSAELSNEEKAAAFKRMEQGGHITITTPFVESGVTLPNIEHVHSTPWVREERLGPDGDKHLALVMATADQQRQRAGRAGRTCKGDFTPHDVRLEQLSTISIPKISTQPLLTTFFDITASGRDAERFLADATYRPPKAHVDLAIHALQTLGVLSLQGNLTKFGESLQDFRGDIRTRIMLRRALELGTELLLEQAIDAAVILEVDGIFSRRSPFNEFLGRGIDYDGWKTLSGVKIDSGSDVVTQTRVFQSMISSDIGGRGCGAWGVDSKKLDEARALREKLRSNVGLSVMNDPGPVSEQNAPKLRECIISGYIDTVAFLVGGSSGSQRAPGYSPLASRGPGKLRQLAGESLVSRPRFVVGKWITIDDTPEDLREPARVITLATKLHPRLLENWVRNSHTAPREVRNSCAEALRENTIYAQQRARANRPDGPEEKTVRRNPSDRGRNRR